jgi:hypothetical protein
VIGKVNVFGQSWLALNVLGSGAAQTRPKGKETSGAPELVDLM